MSSARLRGEPELAAGIEGGIEGEGAKGFPVVVVVVVVVVVCPSCSLRGCSEYSISG